jgi:hypothetical protein
MTTARTTQPHVVELDVVEATVVVVVLGCVEVVVGRARVVGVVGSVVGGSVVVVVGAAVVVVTGAVVVVVVSCAATGPDMTPRMTGEALSASTSAAVRRETFERMGPA